MFDTRVLGVDPGVARLGLAVVARSGRSRELVWADVARTPAGMDESQRLMSLIQEVRAAIEAHEPDSVAIERVAFNRNVVSAMSVARVTGAIMVVAAEAGIAVEEYSPTEVKNAVTGLGDAGKDQVKAALTKIHGLTNIPTQADSVDAIAVALTHLCGSRLRAAARAVVR